MWHSRLRFLFQRAYPRMAQADVEASEDLIQLFIMGLESYSIKDHTLRSRPGTFADALLVANQNRAANVQMQGQPGAPAWIKQEPSMSSMGGSRKRTKADIERMDRENQIICHNCSKKGHRKAYCRSAAKEGGAQGEASSSFSPRGRGSNRRGAYRGRGGRAESNPRGGKKARYDADTKKRISSLEASTPAASAIADDAEEGQYSEEEYESGNC
jgi:hypothetical protein